MPENEGNNRIILRLQGHTFYYPVCDVLRLFTGEIPKEEEGYVTCGSGTLTDLPEILTIISTVTDEYIGTYIEEKTGKSFPEIRVLKKDLTLPPNREVKRQLYLLLSEITGITFPWGSLTGIRPTIVAREVASPSDLTSMYGVREDKAELAFLTMENEDRVLKGSSEDSLHIYIGIPFCPSRCAYCSFVAQEAPKKTAMLPSYVEAVLKEMDLVLPNITQPVETLYIGGGTPTVLEDVLFEKFIRGVFSHKELTALREVCVEAGRPDTITERKLAVLLENGVRRICINPQTLCDATLERVGRRHSAEDFTGAFEMARKMGFSIINTDLIAGLPGETADEFCDSLTRIIALSPENITVHALSKKRRSSMKREEVLRAEEEDIRRIGKMLAFSSETLLKSEYVPYYMYKQKDTMGGHENVGYCREGTECIYNVAMMSDRRSVLSFGSGGMSKRVFMKNGDTSDIRIERCPCTKDPNQYITNVEEMADKKIRFFREG